MNAPQRQRRITVYCGSRDGARPAYRAAAYAFGQALGTRDLALVYGGADAGLMGAVAQGALDRGAFVTGVIPRFFQGPNAFREIAHPALPDLRVVGDMHERKELMIELGDGFVALPGGFGTFEEWFEVITWLQIGLHKKPIGLLNVEGYYDTLLRFLEEVDREGFAPSVVRTLVVERNVEALLDRFAERWAEETAR